MNTDIQNRLIEILHNLKEQSFSKSAVDAGTRIIDDIGIDSLQMINLFLMIEDEFDIEIEYSNVELTVLESIDSLAGFVGETIACDGVAYDDKR